MPVYKRNPKDASAGFIVFPKGDYEVTLGEAKAFKGEGEKGKNYGVRFSGKVTGGDVDQKFIGKKASVNCYQHTDGSADFAKQVQMAALGFNQDVEGQEAEFDEASQDLDWSFNPDDGFVGDGWKEMEGKVLVFSWDTQIVEGNTRQKTVSIRPL